MSSQKKSVPNLLKVCCGGNRPHMGHVCPRLPQQGFCKVDGTAVDDVSRHAAHSTGASATPVSALAVVTVSRSTGMVLHSEWLTMCNALAACLCTNPSKCGTMQASAPCNHAAMETLLDGLPSNMPSSAVFPVVINHFSVQDAEVKQIADSNGKTVAQTLLRWGLQHGTSVIPKSSNPKHIQARLECCGRCRWLC